MVCHKGNSSVCLSVIQPEVGEGIYLRNGGCIYGCGFLLATSDSEKNSSFPPMSFLSDSFGRDFIFFFTGSSLCKKYCKVLIVTATANAQSSCITNSCFLTHNTVRIICHFKSILF